VICSSLDPPLIRRYGDRRRAFVTCDSATSAQIRMARAVLNWKVRDPAEATGLHRNTITNIEVGRYAGNQDSIALIESVFQKACVEFLPRNGIRFQ
jgi:DNA-binding XRE family transcriptional regulator